MPRRDTAWEFLSWLHATLHSDPEELRYNRRRGWLYSTWRWLVLLAPEGVSSIARSLFPDRHAHRQVDRYLLEILGREATYLVRGSSDRIVHRARILYPDGGPAERANVIVVDLEPIDWQLEPYVEFVFKGAIEIYDARTDKPLTYHSGDKIVRTPTPPGFRTVEELKAKGVLRRPAQEP